MTDQTTTPDVAPWNQYDAHLTLHGDAMSLTVTDPLTHATVLTRAMDPVPIEHACATAQTELNADAWALLETWTQTTPTSWTAPVVYCGKDEEA